MLLLADSCHPDNGEDEFLQGVTPQQTTFFIVHYRTHKSPPLAQSRVFLDFLSNSG
jgi:hypothetical protein